MTDEATTDDAGPHAQTLRDLRSATAHWSHVRVERPYEPKWQRDVDHAILVHLGYTVWWNTDHSTRVYENPFLKDLAEELARATQDRRVLDGKTTGPATAAPTPPEVEAAIAANADRLAQKAAEWKAATAAKWRAYEETERARRRGVDTSNLAGTKEDWRDPAAVKWQAQRQEAIDEDERVAAEERTVEEGHGPSSSIVGLPQTRSADVPCCTHCGASVDVRDRFCRACGDSLEVEAADQTRVSTAGTPVVLPAARPPRRSRWWRRESTAGTPVVPPAAGSRGTATLQLSGIQWTPIMGDESVVALLRRSKLDRQAQETFVVLPHRSDLATCGPIEVHRGQFDRVKLSVPVILSAVLAAGVDRFSIAHNHPGGSADPSAEDANVLRTVAAAAETVGLELLASYIVTPTEWSERRPA